MQDYIIYEQPLNEHSRVCLRIADKLAEADQFLNDDSMYGVTACVSAIIDLIIVLDRPDLRNRLAKEFNRYLNHLLKMEQMPNVDQQCLSSILERVQDVLHLLHSKTGRFAQSLRENEFLNNLRIPMGAPGGICYFDVPSYLFWLNDHPERRFQCLKNWIQEFNDIRLVVNLFLELTRASTNTSLQVAHKGFFQKGLESQIAYQLVRILVPTSLHIFPQTSVGRYGISLRFFEINEIGSYVPVSEDIEFRLMCCTF